MYQNYNMYNQFSDFNNYNSRNENLSNIKSEELISLNDAIKLIKKSVGDEREDELFYDNLIRIAPTEDDRKIIESIRNDERKHNQILRDLYYNFTGENIPVNSSSTNNIMNLDYKKQLEKALFGELDAVSKYRKIMGTMPSGDSYTLLMSIMTDELRHASKYNYLIQKAK